MSHAKWLPYLFFLVLLVLLNGFIFLTPYLASQNDPNAEAFYIAFSPTCHQLTSRSLCLFKSNDGSLSIRDCFPSSELVLTKVNEIKYPEGTAYKFPVCARDVAIYLTMLIGLLVLPFFMKIGSEDWPNKWLLVAAAVPIGIDGTGQLLGFWESSNTARLITGAIIGIILPFYILPIINSLLSFIGEKTAKGKKNS